MNNIYLIPFFFLAIGWIYHEEALGFEKRRNNKLREQNEILEAKNRAIKVILRKKKELIEIQDKLIKELNYEKNM